MAETSTPWPPIVARRSTQPPAPLTLQEAAARVGHHVWIERAVFTVLGGWVDDVAEPEVKFRLGEQCYRHAWHAELFGERLPALPGLDPERLVVPPNDAVADFVHAVREPVDPSGTVEKLVGAYRVLLPRMVAAYRSHLDRTSTVTDGPTIRALTLVLRDEVEDWQDGELLVQSLLRSPGDVERAAAHQSALEQRLVAAGGITGAAPDRAPR